MAPKKCTGKRSLPNPDLPGPRRAAAAMAAPGRQPSSLRQTSLDSHVRLLVRHDRDMTDSEPENPDEEAKVVVPRLPPTPGTSAPPSKREKKATFPVPPPPPPRGRSKKAAGKKAPPAPRPGSPTPGTSGVIAPRRPSSEPRRRSPRVLARVLPPPPAAFSDSSSSEEEECGADWNPTRDEQPHPGDHLFSGKFTLH